MILNPALLYALFLPGILLAGLALALRRAEGRFPDPGDIAVRDGLGHMMVGLLAATALVIHAVVALVMGGAPAVLAAVAAGLVGLGIARLGARLRPLYRAQIHCAAAALALALIGLAATINALTLLTFLEGVPDV